MVNVVLLIIIATTLAEIGRRLFMQRTKPGAMPERR